MPSHERFELLCALAAKDQLDPADRRYLDVHLAECAGCRMTLEDFCQVVEELGAERTSVPATNSTAKRAASFAEFARSQGIVLSRSAEEALEGRKPRLWTLPRMVYAAAAILLVAGTSVGLTLQYAKRRPAVPIAKRTEVESPAVTGRIVDDAEQTREIAELKDRLNKAQQVAAEVQRLKEQIAGNEKERSRLTEEIADRDGSIQRVQASADDKEKQLTAAQTSISSLKDKEGKISADLADAHFRVRNLTEDLQAQQLATEQEKQLSSAARDVREMMGARRLFMVDVYDGQDTQRSNRSFGRIFFTEGKSLIFYAFDLDKVKGSKHVTFQAWAEQGHGQENAKHLGEFYIDDVAQKRWVMKVEDPEKLKAVNAVFVTVESGKGSTKPTGAKLLYAYLGGQPNHP